MIHHDLGKIVMTRKPMIGIILIMTEISAMLYNAK